LRTLRRDRFQKAQKEGFQELNGICSRVAGTPEFVKQRPEATGEKKKCDGKEANAGNGEAIGKRDEKSRIKKCQCKRALPMENTWVADTHTR